METPSSSISLAFLAWPYPPPFTLPSPLQMTGVVAFVITLAINIPVLWTLKTKCQTTVINLFIILDVIVCILQSAIVLHTLFELPVSSNLCSFLTTSTFFLSLLNRLIPIGIVTFRYVFVCRGHWVQTARQRSKFSTFLVVMMLAIPLVLSGFCLFYKEQYLH